MVVTAAVCAVVAGYRSYAAIAEWVADVPDATADALGIAADRRPSEAMIRRLLQNRRRRRRRRRRLDEPKRFTTETVYAITDLHVHHAKPHQLAAWIRGHWSIENKIHWVRDVTYDEDRSQIRTGTGQQVMAALRNAAIGALRLAGFTNIAAANRHHARPLTLLASPDDFAGALDATAVSVAVSFNHAHAGSARSAVATSSWSRRLPNRVGQGQAGLESVLGSHPHEFESRILRHRAIRAGPCARLSAFAGRAVRRVLDRLSHGPIPRTRADRVFARRSGSAVAEQAGSRFPKSTQRRPPQSWAAAMASSTSGKTAK
ncbi:transposase [Paractinoplanes brasiliensis]|uniref:transposase n=1 Tax=Paractinoplanes brasiliensis TaxID=52695 RepID=UPI001A503809|nr:transposase [Actinoplanes brasiliensis]GID28890.1 hypothetical protein Abr02nite_38730 [Actinoplanes brasiliensis]